MTGHEEDGRCPGGKQIEAGEKFRGKGGQESPMPAEQTDEQGSHQHVENGIGWRNAACGEERGNGNLQPVGDNGDGPG
ncbi:MAG: hypothetical protein DMG81_03545 [Acidobacteria bacterium]|nr:MAG: hypothetical protein DMG81_03545 [Acidobacteriota bacterium]